MCQGCHGIDGWRTAFPEVYACRSSPASIRSTSSQALKEYKSGERSASVDARDRGVALRPGHGGHRRVLRADAADDGGQMTMTHASTARIALAALAALARRRAAAADIEAGKKKVQEVCAACHGIDGNSPTRPTIPKLAGQYPDYLAKALRDYKSGARKNPIMAGIARRR